jgi:SAM-dependent methyltransferase
MEDLRGFERFFQDSYYLSMKESVFWFQNSKKAVQREMKKIAPKGIVMEAGSGTTPKTAFPKETICTDLSLNAAKVLKNKGHQCFVQDITRMAVKENSAGLIICSEVLEHIPDYRKALVEMHRALEKKGHLLITVPLHQYFFWRDDDIVGHYRRFNPEKLGKELHTLGFENIEIKKVGGFGERIGLNLMIKAFSFFEKKRGHALDASPEKKKGGERKLFLFFWKAANSAAGWLMRLSVYITPRSLSNAALIHCTARK